MIAKSSYRAGFARIAMLTAAALALSAGAVHAGVKKIKKCQTIGKAGFYQVTKNITTNGTGPCLLITASNVILDLNGFNLTGSGAGTGILIMGSNVFIDANDKKGNSSSISNFAVGIEDNGNNAVVENFGYSMNTDTGLYVNGASGSTFGGFGSGNNTNHGVHLRNATGIVLHNFGLTNNGAMGVWVEASSNSALNNFISNTNGIAGVYLGCSPTGPVGAGCAGSNSASNVVLSAGMDSNGNYGTAIDYDSLGNVISGTAETSNPTYDVYDGNTLCGTNLWFNQTYDTGSSNEPTCTSE